ncbi:MAG: outer membrane protein assembly factor BamE [Acinetobacter sp.]
MQKIMLTSVLVSTLLAGCVYKIDIPQGTPLTKAQASQVQVGMTYQQVRFLLGSPTIADPLNPQRWDYVYNYIPGTYAKKAKIPAAHGQHLRIYFDDAGVVTKVEGLESVPDNQPGLPPTSKEAILNAPPL